jgi:hypothetical protein
VIFKITLIDFPRSAWHIAKSGLCDCARFSIKLFANNVAERLALSGINGAVGAILRPANEYADI